MMHSKEATTLSHPPSLQISPSALTDTSDNLYLGLCPQLETSSTIAKYLSVRASLMPSVRKSRSGKRVVRRQKVSRVAEESQRRPCSRVNIGALPDNVLLEIFDIYLVKPDWVPKREDAWHTLVHVCKRWRSIVFASPQRLQLRLFCTNNRPMQNTLDLWPALPIVIEGRRGMPRPQVANNLVVALKQHNRVYDIDIDHICDTLLKGIREMKLEDPFPVLTSLQLRCDWQNINTPPLPDLFLGGSAPQLRRLTLTGIPFPALPKLLLSTHHLVKLFLWDIPPSGYLSPESMVTGLSALTNLQKFVLEFRCPRSRADREKRLLPRLTHIILPALTWFDFKGDSEYMEDFVGQINTPLLDRSHLRFFNQLIFDTPLLCDFISRTESFNALHRVSILFYDSSIKINLFRPERNIGHRTLSSTISCRPLDWQLSSASQVFNSALSHLTFEHLEIDSSREHRKDDTENAEWLEVLRPFASVKDLVLRGDSVPLVAPALEDLAGGRVTELLPALQNLYVQLEQPSGPVKKAIGTFISARRLSGHPVTVHHRERYDQAYKLWEVGDQ